MRLKEKGETMSDATEQIDELIKKCEQAFIENPVLSEAEISTERGLVIALLKHEFAGKRRHEIPEETLEYHYDYLQYFTDKAFRYFFPAYFRRALKTFPAPDHVFESLIYELWPSDLFEANHHARRRAAFSKTEREFIVDFMKTVQEKKEMDQFHDIAEGVCDFWSAE